MDVFEIYTFVVKFTPCKEAGSSLLCHLLIFASIVFRKEESPSLVAFVPPLTLRGGGGLLWYNALMLH